MIWWLILAGLTLGVWIERERQRKPDLAMTFPMHFVFKQIPSVWLTYTFGEFDFYGELRHR